VFAKSDIFVWDFQVPKISFIYILVELRKVHLQVKKICFKVLAKSWKIQNTMAWDILSF